MNIMSHPNKGRNLLSSEVVNPNGTGGFSEQGEGSLYSVYTDDTDLNLRTMKYYQIPPTGSALGDNGVAFIGDAQSTVMGVVRSVRESVESSFTENTKETEECTPKSDITLQSFCEEPSPPCSKKLQYSNYDGYSDNENNFNDNPYLASKVEKAVSADHFSSPVTTTAIFPNESTVISTGFILGRTSLMSIFNQKWRSLVWVRCTETKLLLFRSKDDYQAWATNTGIATEEQRQGLVQMTIDFLEECSKPEIFGFYITQMKLKHYAGEDNNL